MPWRECSVMEERLRFVARLLDGEFNTERPHEALAMKCPAEVYATSPRRYDGLPELQYPFHDRDIDNPFGPRLSPMSSVYPDSREIRILPLPNGAIRILPDG